MAFRIPIGSVRAGPGSGYRWIAAAVPVGPQGNRDATITIAVASTIYIYTASRTSHGTSTYVYSDPSPRLCAWQGQGPERPRVVAVTAHVTARAQAANLQGRGKPDRDREALLGSRAGRSRGQAKGRIVNARLPAPFTSEGSSLIWTNQQGLRLRTASGEFCSSVSRSSIPNANCLNWR